MNNCVMYSMKLCSGEVCRCAEYVSLNTTKGQRILEEYREKEKLKPLES